MPIMTLSPAIALFVFTIAIGELPRDRKVFISDFDKLNCSQSLSELHNIPCLYVDELRISSHFQLIENQTKEVFTTLDFNNPGETLNCDDAFEALDMFEMRKSFLTIEFNEKSFMNEVFKNIFLLAYQRMTEKIFVKCNFPVNERTFKVVDINEEEIEMKYNRNGFHGIAFM